MFLLKINLIWCLATMFFIVNVLSIKKDKEKINLSEPINCFLLFADVAPEPNLISNDRRTPQQNRIIKID